MSLAAVVIQYYCTSRPGLCCYAAMLLCAERCAPRRLTTTVEDSTCAAGRSARRSASSFRIAKPSPEDGRERRAVYHYLPRYLGSLSSMCQPRHVSSSFYNLYSLGILICHAPRLRATGFNIAFSFLIRSYSSQVLRERNT